MSTAPFRLLRRFVALVWVALLVGLLAITALPHVIAHGGRTALVIRGGSMEPTIPLGSLIAVAPVDPRDLVAGDIVTVRADNGVVYTHRVRGILEADAGPRFQLQGDANASADGRLVPGRALIGRVEFHIPYAGYVLALLGMPSGLLTVASTLGTLLLAVFLLEELERPRTSPNSTAAPAAGPAES